MSDQQKPKSTESMPSPSSAPSSNGVYNGICGRDGSSVKGESRPKIQYRNPPESAIPKIEYPNPPESTIPDASTLREQWRFAIRQYSKWYSHAWGTAILAGGAFFVLGWIIKGSNPLPSLQHKHEGGETAGTEREQKASTDRASKDDDGRTS